MYAIIKLIKKAICFGCKRPMKAGEYCVKEEFGSINYYCLLCGYNLVNVKEIWLRQEIKDRKEKGIIDEYIKEIDECLRHIEMTKARVVKRLEEDEK